MQEITDRINKLKIEQVRLISEYNRTYTDYGIKKKRFLGFIYDVEAVCVSPHMDIESIKKHYDYYNDRRPDKLGDMLITRYQTCSNRIRTLENLLKALKDLHPDDLEFITQKAATKP